MRFFLTCLWHTRTCFNDTYHSCSFLGPRDIFRVTGQSYRQQFLKNALFGRGIGISGFNRRKPSACQKYFQMSRCLKMCKLCIVDFFYQMQSNFCMHENFSATTELHTVWLLFSSGVFVVLMYILASVAVCCVHAYNVLCGDVAQCYWHWLYVNRCRYFSIFCSRITCLCLSEARSRSVDMQCLRHETLTCRVA